MCGGRDDGLNSLGGGQGDSSKSGIGAGRREVAGGTRETSHPSRKAANDCCRDSIWKGGEARLPEKSVYGLHHRNTQRPRGIYGCGSDAKFGVDMHGIDVTGAQYFGEVCAHSCSVSYQGQVDNRNMHSCGDGDDIVRGSEWIGLSVGLLRYRAPKRRLGSRTNGGGDDGDMMALIAQDLCLVEKRRLCAAEIVKRVVADKCDAFRGVRRADQELLALQVFAPILPL